MKKNSGYDFSVPTRQSYAAILIITYRLYKILARQLFPVVVIVLLQGKIATSSWFIYSIVAVAILGAVYSIAAFFKYYFFLKEDKLVVEKGVFKKSHLEIPFDRIQSINFEQNLIHRLFNVVRLNMDTAGSVGNELALSALDQNLAQQLSHIILSSQKEAKKKEGEDMVEESLSVERQRIFKLNFLQLLKVGVTENHIRSGGLIIFFFFYIYDSLEEFGLDLIEQGEQYMPVAEQLIQSLIFLIIFVIIFSIIAFLISIIRTVLNFFDLQMYRRGLGFVVVSGLLNKKEKAAKDEKIQLIKSSQNLLQKLTGINELVLKQASSVAINDDKSIKVVGLSEENVEQVRHYILKDSYPELKDMQTFAVDKYYLIRRLLYTSYLFVPLITLSVFSRKMDFLLLSTLAAIVALTSCFLAYKKKRYALSKNIIRVDGGIFGNKQNLIETHKVQNLKLIATPFQRRRSLTTLIIHTASGSVRIPDIDARKAGSYLNSLLYKVEKSRKSWM